LIAGIYISYILVVIDMLAANQQGEHHTDRLVFNGWSTQNGLFVYSAYKAMIERFTAPNQSEYIF